MPITTIVANSDDHTISVDVDGEKYENITEANVRNGVSWYDEEAKVSVCLYSREKKDGVTKSITICAAKDKTDMDADAVKAAIESYMKGK